MKNLENLNVQVLDKKEMKKTEGGFLPVAVVVAIWAIEATICVGLIAAKVAYDTSGRSHRK
jgi:lactobin A/cerein 7B family class IIb bacteriocin